LTATVAPFPSSAPQAGNPPAGAVPKAPPPPGLAVAAPLPDVIPARKRRGKVWTYVRRNPTIVVGGVLLLLALGMALWARSVLSLSTLAPTRTTRQVRQDAQALSERVSG